MICASKFNTNASGRCLITPATTASLGFILAMMATLVVASCNLTPSKPEAVIMVYRDKMRSGKVDQARELLSEQSRFTAQSLDKDYKLAQSAENLSLLNALDPLNMPTPVSVEDSEGSCASEDTERLSEADTFGEKEIGRQVAN